MTDSAYAGTNTPVTTAEYINNTMNILLNYTELTETSILNNVLKTTGKKP